MRCKLSVVRNLLIETSEGEDYMVMHGRFWRPLTEEESLEIGRRVLFRPSENYTAYMRAVSSNLEDVIGKLRGSRKPSLKRKLKSQQESKDEMDVFFASLDKMGVIRDSAPYTSITVQFDDGTQTTCRYKHLWTEVDGSVDFRPDEGLPEDYYAL